MFAEGLWANKCTINHFDVSIFHQLWSRTHCRALKIFVSRARICMSSNLHPLNLFSIFGYLYNHLAHISSTINFHLINSSFKFSICIAWTLVFALCCIHLIYFRAYETFAAIWPLIVKEIIFQYYNTIYE